MTRPKVPQGVSILVRIDPEVRLALHCLKEKGESYNDVVRRLLRERQSMPLKQKPVYMPYG